MIRPQGSEGKRQPEYGSDLMVDLMAALDIEYAAFNPGASFRGIHDSEDWGSTRQRDGGTVNPIFHSTS